jgi:lipoprotein-anchoring transpeptidase ErfK/SrfK
MRLSRRTFLKLSGGLLVGAAGLASPEVDPPEWLPVVRLGRMTESRIRLYNRPHPDGSEVGFRFRDDVVTVLREVVGLGFYPHNHVWFETPAGYAYSAWVQPVRYAPMEPLAEVPADGAYGEVSVPFTEAYARANAQSPVLYRLYYPTTYQITGREQAADGRVWYRLADENMVKMYVRAEHLRLIAAEELSPLSPNIDDKLVSVSLGRQVLTAYEGAREVFRTTIASGRGYFAADGAATGSLTPAGEHPLWQKRISRHMTGGTPTDGYDLPGVPWVSYFSGNGAALHGTYWHNDFGAPKSAGCINLRPEDARWLFRWTQPEVPYVPGHITVAWPGGTKVKIGD